VSDFHSYMWSVSDWRTDEMYMSLDNREQGIYRNLIDECWVSGSIVSNPDILARFVHESLEYFLMVWAKLMPKFRPIDGGKRLICARLEMDRHRLMRNAKFRQKRARKAAETRWNKDRAEKELHATSIFVASLEHTFEHCQTQTQTHSQEELLIKNRSLDIHTGKTAYGRFENVMLSDSEHLALQERFASDLPEKIEAMSEYLASKGKKYKSHYATILTWERKNGNGLHQKPKDKQERNAEAARRLLSRLDSENSSGRVNGNTGIDTSGLFGTPAPLKRH